MSLTHLSLFSGIGGIDLAAEWAGFETVQFCEIDPYCRRVLANNFPGVPIHDDIHTFNAVHFRGVDLVSGGFPCQDISGANSRGQGIGGPKSGLFFQLLRVVSECKPLVILLENSPFLRTRGSDRVLSELERIGYTCGAFVVGAANAGAPHERQRAYVVAHLSNVSRLQAHQTPILIGATSQAKERTRAIFKQRDGLPESASYWSIHQPPFPGVDDGIPHRVDRNRALGNTVCPHAVYPILKAIADCLRSSEDGA